MKELYFLFIFIVAFYFYFSIEIQGINAIGDAGMRTFLFLITYIVLTIYRHYYKQIRRISSKLVNAFFKTSVSTLSIALPLIVITSPENRSHQVNMSIITILALVLYAVTLDLNKKLEAHILEFFEKRANDGGDMFITYPPKNGFDILLPISLYFIIAFIIYWIL